jgi:uncharacterized membrane protein
MVLMEVDCPRERNYVNSQPPTSNSQLLEVARKALPVGSWELGVDWAKLQKFQINMEKSSIGLDGNVAGALAYAMGWVTGVALLLIERENAFVRFHALQSALAFGALSVAWMISLSIPIFGWFLAFVVIPPFSVVLWLFMMFKAYQGERYKLPVVGDVAEQRA